MLLLHLCYYGPKYEVSFMAVRVVSGAMMAISNRTACSWADLKFNRACTAFNFVVVREALGGGRQNGKTPQLAADRMDIDAPTS